MWMRTRSQRVSWSGFITKRTKSWGYCLRPQRVYNPVPENKLWGPEEKQSSVQGKTENVFKDKEGRCRDSLPKEEWETSIHPVLGWICAQKQRQHFRLHGHCEQESRCRTAQNIFRVRGINNKKGSACVGAGLLGEVSVLLSFAVNLKLP